MTGLAWLALAAIALAWPLTALTYRIQRAVRHG